MGEIFSYNGKVSTFFRKCTELLMINTFWLICCMPLFTIGAATTAMYYTIHKCVLHDRGYVTKEFFRSFYLNCKQGIILWCIYVGVGLLFVQDIYYFYHRLLEGDSIGMLWYLFLGLLLILILQIVYTFAYLARFENSIGRTIKESLIIMLIHLGTNIKLVAILLIACLMVYLKFTFILILPASFMLITCCNLEKIFGKYMCVADRELEQLLKEKLEENN